MTPVAVESPWLRAADAAVYARVTKGVVLRACRERRLEHVKVDGRGRVLTTKPWIDAWLASLVVRVAVAR